MADQGVRQAISRDVILFQGKWKLVDFAYWRDGQIDQLPPEQIMGEKIISGNKYHLKLKLRDQQVEDDYRFEIFPDRIPRAFDVWLPNGDRLEGIYEIDVDTIRQCYAQPGQPRPTRFRTGNQTYQLWKRDVEPAKARPSKGQERDGLRGN